jgi:N4-gp56 family major capsid protein
MHFGSAEAAKEWSSSLELDTNKKSLFARFTSEGHNSLVQRLTNLERGADNQTHFNIFIQLKGPPISGNSRLDVSEENLVFYQDNICINQLRRSFSAGGAMTRKRTLKNTREAACDAFSDYWAKYLDELHFIYLSGTRGINKDFVEDLSFLGHADNPIQAPDVDHIMYAAGPAGTKATMVAGDKMTRNLIERAATKAEMMREVNPASVDMQPVMINGEPHFVLLMNPFQVYDLRTADTTGWMDIQKAAAAAEGSKNAIFTGAKGMINNIVLRSHKSCIRFDDYGADSNLAATRALLLGAQAGVVAYGSSAGRRFTWKEEVEDYDNTVTIVCGATMGFKKNRFNNTDVGVLSIDTATSWF